MRGLRKSLLAGNIPNNVMRTSFTLLISWLLVTVTVFGNSDVRVWKNLKGETIRAELVSYDATSGEVILKFSDKDDRTFHFDDFSITDKAWLVEWLEFERELSDEIAKLGGKVEHIVTPGVYPTDLFLYYPSEFKEKDALLPALILFHPGGKAARYLKRHVKAAEASGLLLISCGTFRNTGDDATKEGELFERFKEVFQYIVANIKFDEKRLFMGGTSGGAWRAFHYTAWIDWPWAGIYSNGGWLGGKKYHGLDYADNMRVAVVNGSNDWSANMVVNDYVPVLQKHKCEIAVIAFEGGHQVPPPNIQNKAFNWLLEKEDFDEK